MNWLDMPLFQRVRHIVEHGENIYVRAYIDGRWESVALSQLDGPTLMQKLVQLAIRDVEPTRLLR